MCFTCSTPCSNKLASSGQTPGFHGALRHELYEKTHAGGTMRAQQEANEFNEIRMS